MTKALIKSTSKTPAGSKLERSELELLEAASTGFEAFYQTGVVLERIRVDQEFTEAGFGSFGDYMSERMPCGIQKRQAYNLIAAMKLRPNLPSVHNLCTDATWTEGAIRPLLHKDFTPKDQKRIGGKIATRVKRGEKLTASLVKEICDDERGVKRKKKERQSAELSTTQSAAEVLSEISGQALLWKQTLENVSGEFWADAELDDPGCAERTARNLSDLASFLRS
jgi:hypothetical protein